MSKCFQNRFLLLQFEIYILKIAHSVQDLDWELAKPTPKSQTCISEQETTNSRDNLSSYTVIQNYKSPP